ncbi:MAG: hypothetical protein ABSD03_09385 [Vulcanimicrobiaceae bacterium]|jgi:hypothetical protein
MRWDTTWRPAGTLYGPAVRNGDYDTSRAGDGEGETCRTALEAARRSHEDQIAKHRQQADRIGAILATDGPEQAQAEGERQMLKAHPNGTRGGCACISHRIPIRIGTPLAEKAATDAVEGPAPEERPSRLTRFLIRLLGLDG